MMSNIRGIYDYNAIILNGELSDDELLSVLAHELGHEYFALYTNLGQLGWILYNLSFIDSNFLNSYTYIHNCTNKNEEKFCVVFEMLLLISENNFENIEEELHKHSDYLKKYLNRDFEFFTSIISRSNKKNYKSILELFKIIISYSIIGDLPKISYECLANSRKLQSLLTNVNCKRKLKDIIKFCNETTHNQITNLEITDIDFTDLAVQIFKKFPINNKLPDIGSLSLQQEDTIVLQYKESNNSLVRDYKKNKDKLSPLLEDMAISATISELLVILTEEQEKQHTENPIDRVLFFKDKPFISSGKVLKDKNDQIAALKYRNQSTFIIPYKNKQTSTVTNNKIASYKVIGYYIVDVDIDNEQIGKKTIHEPFVFENLKLEQLKALIETDSSFYSNSIPNILVRLTPQSNNPNYLENLMNGFEEFKNEYVNIFICNPQSQVVTLLNKLRECYEDITYLFQFSDDVCTIEIKSKRSNTFRIYLQMDQKKLFTYKFKNGDIPPSKSEKVNVSLFLYLLNESNLVNQLNGNKLFA